MKYLSLFTGIGGFELGIQQAYEKITNSGMVRNGQTSDSLSRGQEEVNSSRMGDKQAERLRDEPNESTPTCIDNKNTNESNIKHALISEESEQEELSQGRERATNIDETLLHVGDRTAPLCIGYSEIDKYAIATYQSHFNHTNYGDITKINEEELPEFDLIVGGFPCQSFSIAGKRGGFNDTRGTLFFDIARILKAKQPRLLLLENVKGLLSHDEGRTFATIISTLDELGYDLQWQVLNSKNFGVPQNRERVFIVGNRRGTERPNVFPL